jgi:hypothetical protein
MITRSGIAAVLTAAAVLGLVPWSAEQIATLAAAAAVLAPPIRRLARAAWRQAARRRAGQAGSLVAAENR